MTMTEQPQIKYDGMPKPPSMKERLATLRKDEEVMAFLREMRVTEYHWIAEKESGEPLTGGHVAAFDQLKHECEWIMEQAPGPDSVLAGIRSVRILDALGAVVWSMERAKVEEPVPADSTPA